MKRLAYLIILLSCFGVAQSQDQFIPEDEQWLEVIDTTAADSLLVVDSLYYHPNQTYLSPMPESYLEEQELNDENDDDDLSNLIIFFLLLWWLGIVKF